MTHKQRNNDDLSVAKTDESTLPPPTFNPDQYRHYLNEFELTEVQQNELLSILWHMMEMAARLGYGLDPVQMLFSEFTETFSENSPLPVAKNTMSDTLSSTVKTRETGGNNAG